ncbi:MAG: TonB-dependent receptor plug domain-containing protein [Bacteroidaceae bacterium]|nr:TonB-dependent receptor plug domain-containing protein [Bacteroidaceae bacterium]
MKKGFFIYSLLFAALYNLNVAAQDTAAFSDQELDQVEIVSLRVPDSAPFAVANIDAPQIKRFAHTGKELPFLLSRTPGIVAWSENGIGQGPVGMRIRGSFSERINVTLDGVALNSPEDQMVYWANLNSYAYIVGGIQVQRGVGSSTNGGGAFGGNIAIDSKPASTVPFFELNGSYGSYNTANYGASFSLGELFNTLIIDGAFHQTQTDGYIHGTSGHSGSYYAGLTLPFEKLTVTYKNIGNYERMGQAWNGVISGSYTSDKNSYTSLYKSGLGRYNSLYEQLMLQTDGTYSTVRYQFADGTYWSKTTDNFWQNHNLLSFDFKPTQHLVMKTTLFYTYGYGYYDEFRKDNKLSKFGLWCNDISRADFVRLKGCQQNDYGIVHRMAYFKDKWSVNGGISLQNFCAQHFGYLTYMSDSKLSEKYMPDGKRYKYYESVGVKGDCNAFAKVNYMAGNWDLFADLQYRLVYHELDGENDSFIRQNDGTYLPQQLDIVKWFNFFNPKAGFSYTENSQKFFASVAISNREPVRNNYTDNGSYPLPKSEHLTDVEAGYCYTSPAFQAGVDLYYMKYRNQLVQTGQVSNIGEALTTNAKKSYRAGAEFSATFRISDWLSVSGNAALSLNKIKDFDEYVDDWDNTQTGTRIFHYDNTDMPFSPSVVVNGFADFTFGPVSLMWHTGFVGSQYLDNTHCAQRSLPSYTVSSLNAQYTFIPQHSRLCKMIVAGFDIDNIFNAHYAANGWVYSAICESEGYSNNNRYYEIGFMPGAGIMFMGHVSLNF